MTRPFWPAVPVQAEHDTGWALGPALALSLGIWGISHLHLPLPPFLTQGPHRCVTA